jgi:hypothetical protein
MADENKTEQVLVERPACLAPFNDLKVAIELFKEENEKKVFDYKTPKGEQAARSHCHSLRGTKSQIISIHKDAKSEALGVCQTLDGEKNTLIGMVEEMINFHMDPIKKIAEDRKAAIEAAEEALRVKEAAEAAERLKAIEEREAEAERVLAGIKAREANTIKAENERQVRIAAEEAAKVKSDKAEAEQIRLSNEAARLEIKKREDAAQKVIDDETAKLTRAREKFEAEKIAEENKQAAILAEKAKAKQDVIDAAAKVEQDKKDALAKAAKEKQDAIQKTKDDAAEVERKRIATKEAADRLVKIKAENERKRKAEQEYILEVKQAAYESLLACTKLSEIDARTVINNIASNMVVNVTITY